MKAWFPEAEGSKQGSRGKEDTLSLGLAVAKDVRVGGTGSHCLMAAPQGSLSRTGGGNGNPLQWSCLENPRDGGAWWAAVYGVAQSQTRLKRLSSSSTALVN